MNSIIRLLYISRMQANLQDEDIESILSKSREFNGKHGITGVLCCKGSYFIQVLEGPEDEVLRLYLKIKGDIRHHHCFLISIAASDQRLFNNWSMGFVSKEAGTLLKVSELLKMKRKFDPGAEIIKLMRELLSQLDKDPMAGL
jgi:hypothetical protein